MKTLKSILLAATLSLGALSMSANNPAGNVRLKGNGTSEEQIKNMIQVPAEYRQQGFNEKVKVLFLVNNKGNVSQVLAICADPALKKSVELQFQRLNFSQLSEKTLYSVNINFKVI